MEFILTALSIICVFLTAMCLRQNTIINAQHDIILELTHEISDMKEAEKEQDIY